MFGRPFRVTWTDDPEDFLARSKQERDPWIVRRLLAVRLLRMGATLTEAATSLGVSYRGLQKWVRWYRTGGIDALCAHPVGGVRVPTRPLLTAGQEAAVLTEATTTGFVTQPKARAWLAREHAVSLSAAQVTRLFRELRLRCKVPRPRAAKADATAQEAWKKGGLPSR